MTPNEFPGLPPTTPPVDYSGQITQAWSDTKECAAIINELDTKIVMAIAECLVECNHSAEACTACVVGQVENQLDEAGSAWSKCNKKILEAINEKLAHTAFLMSAAGFAPDFLSPEREVGVNDGGQSYDPGRLLQPGGPPGTQLCNALDPPPECLADGGGGGGGNGGGGSGGGGGGGGGGGNGGGGNGHDTCPVCPICPICNGPTPCPCQTPTVITCPASPVECCGGDGQGGGTGGSTIGTDVGGGTDTIDIGQLLTVNGGNWIAQPAKGWEFAGPVVVPKSPTWQGGLDMGCTYLPDDYKFPVCKEGDELRYTPGGYPYCVKGSCLPPPPPPPPPNGGGGNGNDTCAPPACPANGQVQTCAAPPIKPWCPAPAKDVPPPAKTDLGPYIDWCDTPHCDVQAAIDAMTNDAFESLSLALVGITPGPGPLIVAAKVFGVLPNIGQIILDVVSSVIKWTISQAEALMRQSLLFVPCDLKSALAAAMNLSLIGWAERLTAVDMSHYARPIQYMVNWACPTKLPSVSEANIAWFNDDITEADWECWIRANDYCPDHMRMMRQYQRTRPDPLQTTALWYRGTFGYDEASQDKWLEILRTLGVTNQKEAFWYNDLLQFIPGPSDIMRMMVRDVDDKDIVTKFGLDLDFETKYAEQLQKWGVAQGMNNTVARYYWRAHWNWIAPGQMYEMLHRLRDDVLPGGAADPLYTSQADVKSWLQIADYVPGLIDRLIAISYRPITRIDAGRAFDVGVSNKDNLIANFRNVGFTEPDAKVMANARERISLLRNARQCNLLTPRAAMTAYAGGLMSTEDAVLTCEAWFIPDKTITGALSDNDLVIGMRRRKEVVAALKKKFLASSMDTDEALTVMARAGVDADWAAAEVNHWVDLFNLKDKEFTAAQLCKMFGQGLITGDDYYARLTRLGYSSQDAAIATGSCTLDLLEKLLKQAEAESRRAQAAIIAADKERFRRALALRRQDFAEAKFRISEADKVAHWLSQMRIEEWKELCKVNKECPEPAPI